MSLGALLCSCSLPLGELVCPQLETLVSLGALRFGKLVCLSHWNILVSLGVLLWLLLLFHRILPFQHGTVWLPKMDLPPTNWDTTQVEALVTVFV